VLLVRLRRRLHRVTANGRLAKFAWKEVDGPLNLA